MSNIFAQSGFVQERSQSVVNPAKVECCYHGQRSYPKVCYCVVNNGFCCMKCRMEDHRHNACRAIGFHNKDVVNELREIETTLNATLTSCSVKDTTDKIGEIDALIEKRRMDKDSLIDEFRQRLNEDFEEFTNEATKVKNMFNVADKSIERTCFDVKIKLEVVKKVLAELDPETKDKDVPSYETIIKGHNFLLKMKEDIKDVHPHDFDNEQKRMNALEAFMRDGCDQAYEFIYDILGKPNKKVNLYSVAAGGDNMIRYNVHNKKSKRLQMNGIFPLQCGVAATKDTLYIAGGTRDYVQHFNTV
ncbi:MAG: hypothetical protein P4M11_09285, partial [Candidatus Pacebacteria bacterium]|nr:hypothetical protein [Candidatus Paceibacterota bacterium]